MENSNQMVKAFNKVIADSGIQIELWRDFPTEEWKAKIDTSVHDKQIRTDMIEELYNKLDEGVCDMCEHKAFDDKCYLNCRHEVENAKRWLLELKEQKNESM